MERRGVEPRSLPCESSVLPLNYRPISDRHFSARRRPRGGSNSPHLIDNQAASPDAYKGNCTTIHEARPDTTSQGVTVACTGSDDEKLFGCRGFYGFGDRRLELQSQQQAMTAHFLDFARELILQGGKLLFQALRLRRDAVEEPALVDSPVAIPEKPAPAKPVRVHLSGLGLAPWQLEKLLLRLRTVQHGTIVIQAPEGVEEALHFADALKEAFVTGGWTVIGVNPVKTAREPGGLTLSSGTFPPPVEVTTVFSALVTAGIKLSTDLDPSQGKQHAVLFVGSRP